LKTCRRLSSAAALAACLSLIGLCGAAGGTPGPQVTLKASFSPERLGHETTIRLSFAVFYPPGQPLQAVRELRLLLPAGLSVTSSELGLANCSIGALERRGAFGCPTNSLMGHGSAVSEVPFGAAFVREKTRILLFSGPLQQGHPQLLFLASGNYPVIATFAFSSLILASRPPFGGLIDTMLPIVQGVPEGPDVALVKLSTTIGPAGITYRELIKGRVVSFRPKGIMLPSRCPAGGFPFAVTLILQDGSASHTSISVPCTRQWRAGTPDATRAQPPKRPSTHPDLVSLSTWLAPS
jgi:hypothetical protein